MASESLHTYRAYGLTLASPFELPLVGASTSADVTLTRSVADHRPAQAPGVYSREGAELAFDGVFFVIRAPGDVTVVAPADTPPSWIVDLLLGPVLGTLLHLRGELVLHASCVQRDGTAVAFLGEPVWGKSSTAAALVARGWHPHTDDVLQVIVPAGSRAMAVPGIPSFKLWPSACRALGIDVPAGTDEHQKLRTTVAEDWLDELVPLTALFVLDTADDWNVEHLPPGEAVRELIAHSYMASRLGETSAQERHLSQIAHLVHSAACLRLTTPAGTGDLGSVARFVEDVVGRFAAPS